MAKIKLQYQGAKTYRGADQYENGSLTVDPGDIVDVSEQKAAELLAGDGKKQWKRVAAGEGDVPPEAPAAPSAMSSANTPTK